MPPRTRSSRHVIERNPNRASGNDAARPRPVARTARLGLSLALAAVAAGGLGALPASAPAAGGTSAGSGGAQWVAVPKVTRVRCVRSCASSDRPRAGGLLRISGRNLSDVTSVLFHGARGSKDDVKARLRKRGRRSVLVQVPLRARSGRVALVAGQVRSRPSRQRIQILPPPPPTVAPELTPAPGPRDPGAPRLETGTSHARWFYGAERRIRFSYRVGGTSSTSVDLVRAGDGAVVRNWTKDAPAGETVTISWDGRDGAGKIQPEGRYLFRVVASGADGAQARSAQTQDVQRDAFDFYRHIFPVRGRHDFGQEGAEFGAGRGGRAHQGHDVFARCGVRLVAARGGVVKFKQYHSAAGHYVVIDGEGTGVDYAYMHLRTASPFKAGDRVYTGQEIGRIGDSGNARGCHLHFEMWDAPGWYDGGRPFDPLPHLLAWDSFS